MPFIKERVDYNKLNARQQENFNYQKLSGILADYGYITHRLSDDWNGADFLAQHNDGGEVLRVQLKGRFTLRTAYEGRDLYIAFRSTDDWYLFPHDAVLSQFADDGKLKTSSSWTKMDGEKRDGMYSYPSLTEELKERLAPYKIT